MRVAVIGEPAGWHVGRLLAALRARGHAANCVRWRDLGAEIVGGGAATESAAPEALAAAEAVIVRGMPGGGLEEVIFRMDLLGRLASRGTPVVNSPRSLEMAIDKYLSLSRLAAAGLPVPRTIVAQQPQSIRAAWEALGEDAVVKPLFGSCGRGIDRLQTVADLEPFSSAAAEAAGKVVYLQEFVPHDGWDARILLVGDEAFAMRRVAADNWRTNLALGARAETFSPPPDWIDLARRAAATLDTTIAGVDLLPARDGRLLVLEVNAVPGWKGLESVTASDIAGSVVACVERQTRG